MDELIRADMVLEAVKFYRHVTGCGLNQAVEAMVMRKQHQGVSFWGDSLARKRAFERLYAIKDPVIVIEGSWEGDSWGWMVVLMAITLAPSEYHTRYTAHGLCAVRQFEYQVERAAALGRELAEAAGAPFYLTSVEVDDEVRWWDTQRA